MYQKFSDFIVFDPPDISDYIDRFFGNYGNYFSVHIFKMLGLRGKGISSIFTMNKLQEIQDPP